MGITKPVIGTEARPRHNFRPQVVKGRASSPSRLVTIPPANHDYRHSPAWGLSPDLHRAQGIIWESGAAFPTFPTFPTLGL